MKSAGILLPLSSIPSSSSWGVGEIGDIRLVSQWLSAAGLDVLQLLPIYEVSPDETSPYTPLTAMAIDPLYVSIAQLEDAVAVGGEAALTDPEREALDRARASHRIEMTAVRALKMKALRQAFDRFHLLEWGTDTTRAQQLKRFIEEQSSWLKAYTLFRALRTRLGETSWMTWPDPLRDRTPHVLEAAQAELERDILFHAYVQWAAQTQWTSARQDVSALGVQLLGDFPFMVSGDSVDVWSRQQEFRLDASVGTPPDAFSETGQDWGVPMYRWDVMRANDFEWIRDRARRSAALYDGYRIDHVVGFYRTYVRPKTGKPFFTPDDEPTQIEQGEAILRVIAAEESLLVAEDLGTVPDFVRSSLARLGIPGYKVLRWERDWHAPGQPFLNPVDYPFVSVATSSTHDTTPLATWWDEATPDERRKVGRIPRLEYLAGKRRFTRTVRDALLDVLFASGSRWLIVPIQDIFGWRDRINVPASVDADNWTYRLPWPSDSLLLRRESRERAAALRDLGRRHQRGVLSSADVPVAP